MSDNRYVATALCVCAVLIAAMTCATTIVVSREDRLAQQARASKWEAFLDTGRSGGAK